MKKYIRKFLNKIGIDIIKYLPPLKANLNLYENLNYEFEEDAVKCISIVKKNTMLSKRRLVTLYQQVAYCEKNSIKGSFVECGVWKGGAMGLMALANLRFGGARRQLHLFDAFQEICEPDASVDGDRALREVIEFTGELGRDNGKLQPLTGIYDSMGGPGSLSENKQLLEQDIRYPADMINYHVGWFQETLPNVHKRIDQIAILRLDGDWYSSTKVCLEYLFDKVVKGGIVIIDDYGTYEGCRKAFDEFSKLNKIQCFLSSVDSDCRFFVKQ